MDGLEVGGEPDVSFLGVIVIVGGRGGKVSGLMGGVKGGGDLTYYRELIQHTHIHQQQERLESVRQGCAAT